MEYQLTLECCLDLLDREPYGYAALDLLYGQVVHSEILLDLERAALLEALDRARKAGPDEFPRLAYYIADKLQRYACFAAMKADFVTHAIRTGGVRSP